MVFSINGAVADSVVESKGAGQDQVTLTAKAMEDDAMDEGDSMEDGDDSMTDLEGEEGDSMDDGSMEDDSMDQGDTEYPGTGNGGLADGSGVSAGLIGLLIALSVAAVAGLGLRRVRNRA